MVAVDWLEHHWDAPSLCLTLELSMEALLTMAEVAILGHACKGEAGTVVTRATAR
jgi:hypothetical protein